VPVNYEKTLLDSHFVNEYLEELMHQYIDNLNLLYVAFTRAEHSLTAFCQHKKKEPSELGTVSDLIWFHFITGGTNELPCPGQWDEVKNEYHLGQLSVEDKETDESPKNRAIKNRFSETCLLPTMETFSFRERVAIHMESDDYFSDESDESGTIYGKVMHWMMH
jgi:ATP-dependent helicase/nuclease subunit A